MRLFLTLLLLAFIIILCSLMKSASDADDRAKKILNSEEN